jgi:hypothetical protein
MRKSLNGGSNPLYERVSVTIRYLLCAGLFIVPIFYLLFSLAILAVVGRTPYESILGWYSARRPDAFDAATLSAHCFTLRWYEWLRAYRLPVMAGIAGILTLYLLYSRRVWRCLQGLEEDMGRIGRFMIRTFSESGSRQKGLLLALFAGILTYRLYFFFAFPLHPDEACSYLFFARQGFFVAATSYPLPNNHIFFNIICSVLSKLPWLSPKAVMRLPSLVGDLVLLYAIFCLFRRWDGFQRAIGVLAGVAFCYYTSYYAVQGRGYELQEICALVTGLAGWECFCGRNRHLRRGYGLFVIFSVAGIYINPVFLYHFTAMILLVGWLSMRRREYEILRSFSGAVAVTGVLVLILYLPLVLASSWGALKNATQDEGLGFRGLITNFQDFTYVFKEMSYYGRAGFGFMILFAAGAFYGYRKKKLAGDFYDRSLAYMLAMAVSLLIWTLYTQTYPLGRTLCFWILAVYILFVNICYDLFKIYFTRAAPWVFGCFLLLKAAGSLRGLYWERFAIGSRKEVVIYREVEGDLEKLGRLHPVSWQITKSDDYYSMYLRLYLIERGEKGQVVLKRDAAVGEVIFWPQGYPPVIPREGYVLWGDNKRTAEAKSLDIFVAKKTGPLPKGGL